MVPDQESPRRITLEADQTSTIVSTNISLKVSRDKVSNNKIQVTRMPYLVAREPLPAYGKPVFEVPVILGALECEQNVPKSVGTV